jgi:uncharacterized protein
MTSALAETLLAEIVPRLAAEFDPEQIVLFGSHAWGTPNVDSDIDLYVIVTESDEKPVQRSRRAHRCLRGIPAATDVIVKTRSEVERFRHVIGSIEAEVMERGKVVYGRER